MNRFSAIDQANHAKTKEIKQWVADHYPQAIKPTSLKLKLPFPPKELSPNNRGHWAAHARAFKAYKALCIKECWAQHIKAFPIGNIHLDITFCPPDNRARDSDNMLASFKAAQDAIAHVIGIDDRFFETTHRRGPKCNGGAVHVMLTHSIKVAA